MNEEANHKTSASLPRRRLRNYLLNARFQLKYTGMVVGVALAISMVLGYFVYSYARGQIELLSIERMQMEDALMDPDAQKFILAEAQQQDRLVLMGIGGGVLLMVLALGITGILITHRLVGPAYKIRKLLDEVADGKLKTAGKLRKHDELQEIFHSFEAMTLSLRKRREGQLERIREIRKKSESIDSASALQDDLRQLEIEIAEGLEA